MLARVLSSAVHGIDAYQLDVEVDISPGLPTFSIVGLPDTAVKESRDRVVAAVKNSGFDFPTKKITVNLAPADVKKEGAAYDLPIAVGILCALETVKPENTSGFCFVGELALDGELRPVRGVLPIVLGLRKHGVKRIVLPAANAKEASIVSDTEVYPASNLKQVAGFINGEERIAPSRPPAGEFAQDAGDHELDFAEVKGQDFAKRALEIAAAGGHNVVMVGPPGSGKTMLARRLPSILPPLTFEESVETTKIHSVAGLVPPGGGLVTRKPFRAPHHTISDIALIGGGQYPRPGEVSLAHNGVLFLDELPEFHRDVLEVLRQPLEDHYVTVSRAKQSLVFPSYFMLVGSMNPCPCGNYGNPEKECTCNPFQIKRYRSKISGPLLDRIDMHLEVPALKTAELTREAPSGEPSGAVRAKVLAARGVQKERFKDNKIHCNAQMGTRHIRKHCRLGPESRELLKTAIDRLGISGRAYDRILKVARTIADLAGAPEIAPSNIAEAIQYRSFDKKD